MDNVLVDFLGVISNGISSLWTGVILRVVYLEWAIAIPLILSPILQIVHFILSQLNEDGGE